MTDEPRDDPEAGNYFRPTLKERCIHYALQLAETRQPSEAPDVDRVIADAAAIERHISPSTGDPK